MIITGGKVRLTSLAVALGALAWPLILAGQGITLADGRPRGLVPGTQTTCRFVGKNLAEAGLWMSFPGRAEEVASSEHSSTNQDLREWRITVPETELPRVVAVRAFSARGFSDPLLMLIDPLPTVAAQPGHRQEEATEIPVPSGVDGKTAGFKRDYYRFHAEAGQQFGFEVVAQRLGSAMDPVLTLRNDRGSELMFSDDDPALGGDARFEFTFTEAGGYLLEIHDVEFRAGLPYRLRIGSFKFSTTAFPTGARPGREAFFTLTGPSGVVEPSLRVPAEPRQEGIVPVGTNALAALVCYRDVPQGVECEPNDSPELAMNIPVSIGLSGRLDDAGDVDYYRFTADSASNSWLKITPQSASLGSPVALTVEVRDALQKVVSTTGEGAITEKPLWLRPESGGSYLISVRDQFGRGGSDSVYHLLVETSPPPFSLTLTSADRVLAAPHSVVKLQVRCDWHGLEGPVDLTVAGLTEPFTLTGNRLAWDQKSTDLRIHFPRGWRQDKWKMMRIIGQASWKGDTIRMPVTTQPLFRQRFPQLPTALVGQPDAIFVSPVDPPICVAASASTVALFPGGKAVLPVAVTRKPGGEKAEPIQINLSGLPSGVSQEAKLTLAPDKQVGEIRLTANDNAAPTAAASIRIEAITRYLGQDLVIQSAPLTLTVSNRAETIPAVDDTASAAKQIDGKP